jgi:hypothetical protein
MYSTDGFSFSDVFDVTPDIVESHGALDISLLTDFPAFIDPFLLYASKKKEYKTLHEDIIDYLRYLRDQTATGGIHPEMVSNLFSFSEVSQTWLGFSKKGNSGRGLGVAFAKALSENMTTVFQDFGREEAQITMGTHLEKLTLFRSGVGRDMISDFTTNLIKNYLLHYTEDFAQQHIAPSKCRDRLIKRAFFDYNSGAWMPRTFVLPYANGDHVILTPTDMLTCNETWICRSDMFRRFDELPAALGNSELRENLNRHFADKLGRKFTKEEKDKAIASAFQLFPQLMDHYIRLKEDTADDALRSSRSQVGEIVQILIDGSREIQNLLNGMTRFYDLPGRTIEEARSRANYLKDVVEKNGGWKAFWIGNEPMKREQLIQIMYRMVWYDTVSDVSTEVDDGRGPADVKISRGSADKCIVEFKLASNTHLKKNLAKQAQIYAESSGAKSILYVVFFFDKRDEKRLNDILNEMPDHRREDIIIVDARRDNKPSASTA